MPCTPPKDGTLSPSTKSRAAPACHAPYFRDKEELLFGIGERATSMLRDRSVAAVAGHASGIDQVEAIGRAYMGYAHEFPHYFDFCARFQAHSVSIDPGSNEGAANWPATA
jgi:AcrR family transcriptional regulator